MLIMAVLSLMAPKQPKIDTNIMMMPIATIRWAGEKKCESMKYSKSPKMVPMALPTVTMRIAVSCNSEMIY